MKAMREGPVATQQMAIGTQSGWKGRETEPGAGRRAVRRTITGSGPREAEIPEADCRTAVEGRIDDPLHAGQLCTRHLLA